MTDSLIENVLLESELSKYDDTLLNEEMIKQSLYHLTTHKIISELRSQFPIEKIDDTGNNDHEKESVDLKRILSLNQGSIARPPVLNCQVFTGEEDRDEFRQFFFAV